MKKITLLGLGIIGMLVLNSCSGIKVFADMDPNTDWSQYKTLEYYGWAEESDQILTRFDKERIEQAFATEFRSRGIEIVEDEGDMIVALFIVVEQKTGQTATTTHMGGYYGGYGGYYGSRYGYGPGYAWGGGQSYTTVQEYDYAVGTLVCSVYDREKESLIWEGIGTKTVSEDPARREHSIPKAVKAIMAKFPVRPSR